MIEKSPVLSHRRLRLAVVALLAAALGIAFIVWNAGEPSTAMAIRRPPRPSRHADQTEGLRFRLTEVKALEKKEERPPLAATTPLSTAETNALFAHLPPSKIAAATEFALPVQSLPPPRPGKVNAVPFPPSGQAVHAGVETSKDLQIVRHSPDGTISSAVTHLSLTFSQPMVAVTSHSDNLQQKIPAVLRPEIAGHWRWVGTKTLFFEPAAKHFPMSTKYTVTVPAGTRSAVKGALDKQVVWSFSTNTATVKNFYPHAEYGPQPLNPIMVATFDQKVDPSAVLKKIRLLIDGKSLPIVLASDSEVKADEIARDTMVKEKSVAFKAAAKLPGDSKITVAVGPGVPSAEGPLTTEKAQTFYFRTYGQMKITSRREKANPGSPWTLWFTNPIDMKTLKPSMVKISPDLPDLHVSANGQFLQISGQAEPRTKYSVTISSELQDVFGQNLQESGPIVVEVLPYNPQLEYQPGFVTLDPCGPLTFNLSSINEPELKVRMYAVTPDDYNAFASNRDRGWRGKTWDFDRSPTYTITVHPKGSPDEWIKTPIDLNPVLKHKPGHVVLAVETSSPSSPQYKYMTWVQATQIGLDAFIDGEKLLVWATSLRGGKPLPGITVSSSSLTAGRNTDKDGAVVLPLGTWAGEKLIVARRGDDTALCDNFATSTTGRVERDAIKWYVLLDRDLYKPGETVHGKGWVRRLTQGPEGDITRLGGDFSSVLYEVFDSMNNSLAKGQCELSTSGGFNFAFALKEGANLGYARVHFTLSKGAATAVASDDYYLSNDKQFQIQEFRNPEFEVSVKPESAAPCFIKGNARVSIAAKYYAGGGLPNAPVHWSAVATQTTYHPPKWNEFVFGMHRWFWETWMPSPSWLNSYKEMNGLTDGQGFDHLRLDFDSVSPALPASVVVEASVVDVNRQTWTDRTTLIVHPSEFYVGLKSDHMFVHENEPVKLSAVVTDIDGKPQPGRKINFRWWREDWSWENGEYKSEQKDLSELSVTSATDPISTLLATKQGGTYKVQATVTDEQGRENLTELTVWVAGRERVKPDQTVAQQTVQLIPDKEQYQPGDVAEIMVQSPFENSEGLMILKRQGIVTYRHFSIPGTTATLKIPMEDAFVPNVHVEVDVVGSVTQDNATAPAFAVGEINLDVPPTHRTLKLAVSPRQAELMPGASTKVDISLTDASGAPVANGDVALAIVDESVLALSGYKLPDPIGDFYSKLAGDVSSYHQRASVVLKGSLPKPVAYPQERAFEDYGGAAAMRTAHLNALNKFAAAPPFMLMGSAQAAARPALQAAAKGTIGTSDLVANQKPLTMRSNFASLVLFEPTLHTDASGKISVDVKLPDTLTRYRIMAVAAKGEREFGSGESSITARLPLMVRPSAPRFLRFGDEFEMPVVVQNQTDKVMTVDVGVRASNIALIEAAGKRVQVPARDRVEIRFPAKTEQSGDAHIQVVAAGSEGNDAAAVSLPVWTPATTEAFATYGQIDEGNFLQPIKAPSDVFPQFGHLDVTTSSTGLQGLTDAFVYLVDYPFECSEQLSSRILAVAAVKDVLTAFKAPGLPAPDALRAKINKDIDALQTRQGYDGGFGLWQLGDKEYPYVCVHVMHALQKAREKDFAVSAETIKRGLSYLRNIDSKFDRNYSPEVKNAIKAYALYVRNELGDSDPAAARKLINTAGMDNLSFESLGWLLPTLCKDVALSQIADQIMTRLNNSVEETASTAEFKSSYGDNQYLLMCSGRRVDGVILDALIVTHPKSDLIPKLVNGLLAHRKAGRWENTQENAFVLLALDHYFNAYESVTPEFVARVWLGDRFAGEAKYSGRSTDRNVITIPMQYLTAHKEKDNVLIGKEGPGRLYYRIGMSYAPRDLMLKPSENGFAVERTYEAVDNASDVSRDNQGHWHIKSGSTVRVKLVMSTPARRYHVALVDPLASGLEPVNHAFATTAQNVKPENGEPEQVPFPAFSAGVHWIPWMSNWYEHENLRDDRAEAFTSLLWDGVHTYSYEARATTPGKFIVPPTKAEEMYAPETFGRGGSDEVIVE